MERRNVSFPEDLLEKTEQIARENSIKFADVVRTALQEYVDKYESMRNTDG